MARKKDTVIEREDSTNSRRTSTLSRQALCDEETSLLAHQEASRTCQGELEDLTKLDAPWSKPRFFFLIEIAIFTNVFLAGFDGTVTASTYALISSDLHQSSLASWITTSYLLTSTAVQPLYGRFSDIFGRRSCLLAATALFGLGCLGCAVSTNMMVLIIFRAIAGLGGGGLMTMTTIINTDLIPTKHRGMYQAIQNILHGSGAICGATLGGVISVAVGWRMCFLAQVPIAMAGLSLAAVVIKAEETYTADEQGGEEQTGGCIGIFTSVTQQLDLSGAALLFSGLVLQLAALNLGSERSWTDPVVITPLIISIVILGGFVAQEYRCKVLPILPLRMLVGRERVALLISNICLGVTAYGILFLMPFFFQTVLLDKASTAGLRLVPPSFATPLGGLTTGVAMRYGDTLTLLTRAGLILMLASNIMVMTLGTHDAEWKYSAYLVLGNYAQGMTYPSILFGLIRTAVKNEHAVATSIVYLTRSMGTVWGVAAVSTLVQSSIYDKLKASCGDLPGADAALEQLRRSVSAIRDLDLELQQRAIQVYYENCWRGFLFLFLVNLLALACTFLVPLKHASVKGHNTGS